MTVSSATFTVRWDRKALGSRCFPRFVGAHRCTRCTTPRTERWWSGTPRLRRSFRPSLSPQLRRAAGLSQWASSLGIQHGGENWGWLVDDWRILDDQRRGELSPSPKKGIQQAILIILKMEHWEIQRQAQTGEANSKLAQVAYSFAFFQYEVLLPTDTKSEFHVSGSTCVWVKTYQNSSKCGCSWTPAICFIKILVASLGCGCVWK